MIRSMTGYGRGSAINEGREITIELKSVNHRYLDLGIRLPKHILFLEDTLRSELNAGVSRGHIDIFINYINSRKDAHTVIINESLLSEYISNGREAGKRLGIMDDIALSSALRLPDVLEISEAEEDREAVTAITRQATKGAIAELQQMRLKEGEAIKQELMLHLDIICGLVIEIEKRAPMVVEEYRSKLNERIEKLLSETELDRARLSTEVAIFADRASIDEEIARLKSHTEQFKKALSANDAVGRKLDFIVQEINREFNTIGSKANDIDLVNFVIEGKSEVEKLREQVQNIE